MNKQLFTVHQIAEYCEVDDHTVLKWLNKDYNKNNPHKLDHLLSIDDFVLMIKDAHQHFANVHQIKPKALIIEDELNVAKCLTRAFEKNKIETHSVQNGFKAILQIAMEKPSIITLDLNLLSLSGYQVLSVIKGLELNHKMWVIIISGDTEKKLQEALAFGADFYLEKPFAMSDLEKLINKLHPQKNTLHQSIDLKNAA